MITLPRILLIALSLHCGLTIAETLQGKVVAVTDGDTVTVLDSSNTQWKVRLMGIDAPEKRQPFGAKSKESLSGLVYGKQVSVEYRKQDRYGRTVGKITVDGVDANLEQIRAGLAWHYKKYEKEQAADDIAAYAGAEEIARSARKGLWQESDPIPPWQWRQQKRSGE